MVNLFIKLYAYKIKVDRHLVVNFLLPNLLSYLYALEVEVNGDLSVDLPNLVKLLTNKL